MRSYLVWTGVATATDFIHGRASCPCLDPCADVLNLAIYKWLTVTEGGAYNIGYVERLRAHRQFLTSVGSELRLTLHSMGLVGQLCSIGVY